MKTRGERLKERRLELHLTLRAAAKLLEISTSGVQNLERGDVMPTLDLGVRISKIYNKSLEWVLNGDENTSDRIPIVGNTITGPHASNTANEFIRISQGNRNLYGLIIVDNIANGSYINGDVILIDADAKPVSGEDVIIKTIDDEIIIRKLSRRDDEYVYLDSITPHLTRVVKKLNDIVFMHPVVGCMKSFLIERDMNLCKNE